MRGWKNEAQPNETVFFTSTVLGYAPVMGRPSVADRMCSALLQVHRFHGCLLRGFVVMPEHIHFITRLSSTLPAKQFMQRLKSATAKWLTPDVDAQCRALMDADPESSRRGFWQDSFRSTPLSYADIYVQKLNYIHENPVRRGLCKRSGDYRWSSAWIYERAELTEEQSLADCDLAMVEWPPLPDLRRLGE